jgi:hypothetical protein
LLAATLTAGVASCGTDKFTVATWNIGHFSLGTDIVSKLPASEGDKWREAYRGFVDPVGARIMFVEEYSPYMDTEKTLRVPENVFGAYKVSLEGPCGGGGHVNSIFANDCTYTDTGVYAYNYHFQNTNFHYMLAMIGGLEVLVIATHLEPNWPKNNAKMRQEQMRQLIEATGDFPRVIIGGDWNVDSPDEWKLFAEAGFTLANDGSYKTCYSWDPKMAIDNVIVRGFAVSDVSVHPDKRLSDHCLLSCSLAIVDRRKVAQTSRQPRYEPFLTAEERIVWKDTDIASIRDVSATIQGRWVPVRRFAKGVIVDRTPKSFTVQFQARDGYCKAVRAYFRQKGPDVVACADKAGFAYESYCGEPLPDEAFKHELATSADNGAYGVCRIVPSASYPIVR